MAVATRTLKDTVVNASGAGGKVTILVLPAAPVLVRVCLGLWPKLGTTAASHFYRLR